MGWASWWAGREARLSPTVIFRSVPWAFWGFHALMRRPPLLQCVKLDGSERWNNGPGHSVGVSSMHDGAASPFISVPRWRWPCRKEAAD